MWLIQCAEISADCFAYFFAASLMFGQWTGNGYYYAAQVTKNIGNDR